MRNSSTEKKSKISKFPPAGQKGRNFEFSKRNFSNAEPVSRAENKLADANKIFDYNFKGKVVLDIGSSTGGFTEYALKNGAKKVFAVEKGTHQMKAPLRFSSRIKLMEKTDIFKTGREKLGENIDVVVADVSFVSLKKVLAHTKNHIASSNTVFLVMLKPQFEAKPYELKNGIVKNNTIRRDIIKDFELWLKNSGFLIIDKRDNVLRGRFGNQERFYYLKTY